MPAALVVAIPTETPSSVNVTSSSAMGSFVIPEVRVAVKVAGPPKEALAPTLSSAVLPWLTTRSPARYEAAKVVFPAKLATTAPVWVPISSVVGIPGSVATPSPSVMAVPTVVPSRVKVIKMPGSPTFEGSVSVAVKIAVPPNATVPPTFERVEAFSATTRSPVPLAEVKSVAPAKVAPTAPAWVAATFSSVATPLLLVVAEPTEVPSTVKLTVWFARPWFVVEEVRVAVKIAVPPTGALPATFPSVATAWLTTRSPVPVEGARSVVPTKVATTTPVWVPTTSSVAAPMNVATPLASVVAIPTETLSRVKATSWLAIPWPVTEDVRVAVSVAVPPREAVPPTLPMVVVAWVTTRSPAASVAAA